MSAVTPVRVPSLLSKVVQSVFAGSVGAAGLPAASGSMISVFAVGAPETVICARLLRVTLIPLTGSAP